jgi:Helix-turn-helix domain
MATRNRRSDRSGRAALSSPGRPPMAGRDERRRFWAAIAAGIASEDAAIEAGVPQAIGTRWFRTAGGLPPSMVRRSAKPLSGRYLWFAEREEIALLGAQGCSMPEIARQLGRAASTISGIGRIASDRRNAATRSGGLAYRATTAHWHAERAARRPKPAKLARNTALRPYGEEPLAGDVMAPSGAPVPGPAVSWTGRRHGPRQARRWANACSPEQIARRLPVDFPDDETMRISHEVIYQALFVQGRGALRRELTACLRSGRALRTPRARTRRRGKSFISPDIMISQRPAEAADRAVPGHWIAGEVLRVDHEQSVPARRLHLRGHTGGTAGRRNTGDPGVPLTLRIASPANTVCRPGQPFRASSSAAVVLANTDQPAMRVVEGVAVSTLLGARAEAVLVEMLGHRRMRCRMMAFKASRSSPPPARIGSAIAV